jgi:hypothetical protein
MPQAVGTPFCLPKQRFQHVEDFSGDQVLNDIVECSKEPVRVSSAGHQIIFSGIVQYIDCCL